MMSIKDLAEEIMEKLNREGFYSEIPEDAMKQAFSEYLHKEYKAMLKVQTSRLKANKKETNKNPDEKEMQKAYGKVEEHLVYVTQELAANTEEDMDYLRCFII